MVKAPDEISGVGALCELKDQCRLLQFWFLPFPNILPAIREDDLDDRRVWEYGDRKEFPEPTDDSSA